MMLHGMFERLNGLVLDRPNLDDAGVVDQHVDAAEARERLVDQALACRAIRQVRRDQVEVVGAQVRMSLQQAGLRPLQLFTIRAASTSFTRFARKA